MENFQVYRDIQARTGGDIYIGVVGPVRTGKSTFIRRFMELVALPDMEPAKQAEVRDQLPLSGSGMREYEKSLDILGERNSYSKTDPDACTAMTAWSSGLEPASSPRLNFLP